jgi:hypothetical protein
MSTQHLNTIASALRLYEAELEAVAQNLEALGDPEEDVEYFRNQSKEAAYLLDHLKEYQEESAHEGIDHLNSLKDFGLYVEVIESGVLAAPTTTTTEVTS